MSRSLGTSNSMLGLASSSVSRPERGSYSALLSPGEDDALAPGEDGDVTRGRSESDTKPTGCLHQCLPKPIRELREKYEETGRLPLCVRRMLLLAVAASLFVDVGTDAKVISILFRNPHAQRLAWIATGTIIAPQVLIWMFLRYYGMVEIHDLLFSVTQIEFVVQIMRSWPTGEKSLGFFWYSVAEGCIEGPINSLLSMYCMLLFADEQAPWAFFLSTFMSLISTSRAGISLDFYGRSETGSAQALRFAQRFLDAGVRVLSLAIFAYVTRPPEATLAQNAAVLIWAVMGMDLFIMFALVHVVSPTYPVSSKCLFAVVLWVAAPPQCLSSLAQAEPGYRMIRMAELGLMGVVGWYHVSRNQYKQLDFLRENYGVLLEVFVALLGIWFLFNLVLILRSLFPACAGARSTQDRKGPLAWALSSAICQDRDPVLTGLLVKELGGHMQHFSRTGLESGDVDEEADDFVRFKPTAIDERGAVTVLTMALDAGPFELLKVTRTSLAPAERVEASVRVVSAVVVSCDEEQLFPVKEEDKRVRGSAPIKDTKPDPTPLDRVVEWLLQSKQKLQNLPQYGTQCGCCAVASDESVIHAGTDGPNLVIGIEQDTPPPAEDTLLPDVDSDWNASVHARDTPAKVAAYRLLKQVAGEIVGRIKDIRYSRLHEDEPNLEAVGVRGTANYALLFKCIAEKNVKCLQFLLDAGADVFARDGSHRTPLEACLAIEGEDGVRGWPEGEELLKNARDHQAKFMSELVDRCNVKDLLTKSKSWGNMKPLDHVVQLILQAERQGSEALDSTSTPKSTADRGSFLALRVGFAADPVHVADKDVTLRGVAAKIAARVKNFKGTKEGKHLDGVLSDDISLLFDSIHMQQQDCLELLLNARADVIAHDPRDRLERTPLHVAMALDWPDGVSLLEEHNNGEDLYSKKDIHGSTPEELHEMMKRYAIDPEVPEVPESNDALLEETAAEAAESNFTLGMAGVMSATPQQNAEEAPASSRDGNIADDEPLTFEEMLAVEPKADENPQESEQNPQENPQEADI